MSNPVAFLGIINLVVFLILLVMFIYGFALLVKLATRGIKALDIYIEKAEQSKKY